MYCKIPDNFGQWRNIGIYFICTAKFLTFLDSGGISYDLFYLYCKIPDNSKHWGILGSIFFTPKFLIILEGGGILGSILFVLQNFWHFWKVEEFRIYFICTAKFMNSWNHESMPWASTWNWNIISNVHQLLTNIQRRNI